jgi:hypothetical protein
MICEMSVRPSEILWRAAGEGEAEVMNIRWKCDFFFSALPQTVEESGQFVRNAFGKGSVNYYCYPCAFLPVASQLFNKP